MNAQSTPVSKNPKKTHILESFSELTPIKDCVSQPKGLDSNCDLFNSQENGNFVEFNSSTERRRQNFCSRKNKRTKGKFVKQLINCERKKADCLNSKQFKNKPSSTYKNEKIKTNNNYDDDEDLFDETFLGGLSDFMGLCEQSINKLKSPVREEMRKNNGNYSNLPNGSPKSKVQKLDEDLLRDHMIGEAAEKISEILTASDVMKWSDESLLPQDKMNLSSKIKRKLLENINNIEIFKSQTTGWTQLNSSAILNAEKNIIYEELGDFYGLPSKVQKLYEDYKGIKQLYEWQEECLNLDAVKSHKNFIYALPTSGGKTLVAELLILKELLCYKKNVLFILPYVSIVQEKIKDFSHFALELGFLVEEYAAGKGVIPPKKRRRKNSLLIATIEKAQIIVNSLIENNRLHEFGMIVVDELHMLSEEGRGAILESLLVQILYKKENIQIIGMTATIGNLLEVGKFLNAESYLGNFRPVTLHEYLKCENKIYSIDWTSEAGCKEVRSFSVNSSKDCDPDGITQLVLEVIPNDSVLIFCATRKNCENVALLLSKNLPKSLMKFKEQEKKSLYRALISESNDQICPVLRKTLPYGVAYHHSGLTTGERKLLEESFRDETISVICCTSTLAVGVNLPAKRVILRSPYIGKDFITLSKYKQMIGRAGRSGLGSEGESFLLCQTMDFDKVKNLLHSQMDETTSKIDFESCRDLVLSSIGLGIATTRKSLRELMACSMLYIQRSKLSVDTKKLMDTCIASLYKQGALKVKIEDMDTKDENYSGSCVSKLDLNITVSKKSLRILNNSQLSISRLGRAAMKGGLSLEKAHDLYSDLVKAQSSLVLLTNLHLLYLVSPPEIICQIKPDCAVYFNIYMQLNSNEVHTAKIIGVTEFVMSKIAMGRPPKNVQESIINRFYVSLVLNELWKQQTVWDVATIFQLPRGQIQTLMTSAATFANCVLRFCEELEEFWCFKSLLTDFAPRLAYCCSVELLPLMDLPAVKRGRAKQLFEAGFKTLPTLAGAKPTDLVRLVDHMSLRVASQIVAAAKLLLMEKAENLKEEAEDVLEGLAERSVPKEIF